MAGRVVQAQAFLSVFFDQQVAAITLDDGGHGDVGFPSCIHGRHYQGGGLFILLQQIHQSTLILCCINAPTRLSSVGAGLGLADFG